jgi:outer membrane murein-binding lipoprotein Lpp
MKKAIMFFAALIAAFTLASCGNDAALERVNSHLHTEVRGLEQTVDSLQTENEDLKWDLERCENIEQERRDAAEKRLTSMGCAVVDTIDKSMLFGTFSCENVDLGANLFEERDWGMFPILSIRWKVGNSSIAEQLRDPQMLWDAYQANRKYVKWLCDISPYVRKNYFQREKMLPFFEETLDKQLIADFESFFEIHNQNRSVPSMHHDTDEWEEIVSQFDTIEEAEESYHLWMFVNRRKAEGGKELLNTVAKILKDLDSAV